MGLLNSIQFTYFVWSSYSFKNISGWYDSYIIFKYAEKLLKTTGAIIMLEDNDMWISRRNNEVCNWPKYICIIFPIKLMNSYSDNVILLTTDSASSSLFALNLTWRGNGFCRHHDPGSHVSLPSSAWNVASNAVFQASQPQGCAHCSL